MRNMTVFAIWIVAVSLYGFCAASRSPGQAKPASPPSIEGEWTQIYHEAGGNSGSAIIDEQIIAGNGFMPRGPMPETIARGRHYSHHYWKISKDKMQLGNENKPPYAHFEYRMHPDGQPGAMDIWSLEPDGTKKLQRTIYHLKDGFLFVTYSFPDEEIRPKGKVASQKEPHTYMMILRKGHIK